MSKGEEYIASILKESKVSFEREKTFSDLKKGLLRYDFFLPDIYGGCIIEYDGEQHFYQIKTFQKKRSDFLKQQEHDRVKNSYCLAKKIKLFRIPYWKLKTINNLEDLFSNDFLVKTKWHNDIIVKPGGRI